MSWESIKNNLYEKAISIIGGFSTMQIYGFSWADADFNLFHWIVATIFGCVAAALFAIIGQLAKMIFENSNIYIKIKKKKHDKTLKG